FEGSARHGCGVELDEARGRRRRQHLPVMDMLDAGVRTYDGSAHPTRAYVDDEDRHGCERRGDRWPRQLAAQPPMVPPSASHRTAKITWAIPGAPCPATTVIVVAKAAITT